MNYMDAGNQVLNKQGSEKKKSRLQKELASYKNDLNGVVMRSHRLVEYLRQIIDKKNETKSDKN